VADLGQRAAVAVDDAERAVVASGGGAVADGESLLPEDELVGTQAPGRAHVLAGASVEIGDIGATVGDHQCLAAALDRGPPVIDE